MNRLEFTPEAWARLFQRGDDTADCTSRRPFDPMTDNDFPDGTYLLTMPGWQSSFGSLNLGVKEGKVASAWAPGDPDRKKNPHSRAWAVGQTVAALRDHARRFGGQIVYLNPHELRWDPFVGRWVKG